MKTGFGHFLEFGASDGLEILSARDRQVGMVTWTKVETDGP